MASSSAQTKMTVMKEGRRHLSFISPPPHTVPNKAALPLTFLDIPWLLFTPSQTLFFYRFPTSVQHFKENVLPKLEHSLSLTLQHFFPLAGTLVTTDDHGEPVIEYSEGDCICITVDEARGDDDGLFENLVGNHQRLATDFHGLTISHSINNGVDSSHKEPLLYVNITIFPECGVSMDFTLRHVAADGRTFNNFLRTWAASAVNKNGFDQFTAASHDRSIIKDPRGLKSIFLKDWSNIKSNKIDPLSTSNGHEEDSIRATFVMGPTQMEKIKNWILTRSESLFGLTHLLLSPYVLTCAHIWVCWLKTHWPCLDLDDETNHYFGFIAGGFTRLNYPIPNDYVGNFVAFGRAMMTRSKLMGNNGIAYGAKAIGDAIKNLNANALAGAEDWISEWEEMRGSNLHVTVTGSPKLSVYGLDFGLGRPVKIEELSIDGKREISLREAKDVVGGIEIGLVLHESKMEAFSGLYNKGLELLMNGP